MDRPEDIEVDPYNGDVYFSLTNNVSKKRPHGAILKITEEISDADTLSFKSSTLILGSEVLKTIKTWIIHHLSSLKF